MEKLFRKYKEIILYIVFGVSTTIVNWVIYSILVSVLQLGMTLSNAVAWFGAVFFAFVTNKLFVFESRNTSFRALIREVIAFWGTRVISGLLEIFLPSVLYAFGFNQDMWGIEGFWSKAVVSVIVVVFNYILSKFMVFK